MKKSLLLLLFFSTTAIAVPLPSEFKGITLNSTAMDVVVSLYGSSELQEIPNSHHEHGKCYKNTISGNYVVFITGPMGGGKLITSVKLQDSPNGLKCSDTDLDPGQCLGQICLGMQKQSVEKILGTALTHTNDGSDLDVAVFEYSYKLPLEKIESFNLPDGIDTADVNHGVVIKFEGGVSTAIEVFKTETF